MLKSYKTTDGQRRATKKYHDKNKEIYNQRNSIKNEIWRDRNK